MSDASAKTACSVHEPSVCRGCAVNKPPGPPMILTRAEVAAWLKIKPRQVERLGVPCLDMGRKTKRYLREDVERWLQRMRKAD